MLVKHVSFNPCIKKSDTKEKNIFFIDPGFSEGIALDEPFLSSFDR